MAEGDIITIIFIHYSPNIHRSELAIRCFKQLYETIKHLPVELIVVDNGGNYDDSKFFLNETEEGRITHYVRNTHNLWYGYARNQGLGMATGEYICIIDNDIMTEQGWLEKCVDVLSKAEGKHFITPLRIDHQHRWEKWFREPVIIGKDKYATNAFAGSSCWVMKKKDAEELGTFENESKAGTRYLRRACRKGYSVIVFDSPHLAHNLGTRDTVYVGYQKKGADFKISKTFINGKENILNGYTFSHNHRFQPTSSDIASR